jgi:hypothetical protein
LNLRRYGRGCVRVSEGRLHWQHHDSLDILSF